MNKIVILIISLFISSISLAIPNGTGPAGVGGGGGGGGASTLNGLSDVDTTGAAATNVICYDGANWTDCPVGAPGAHATTHEPGNSDPIAEFGYTPSDNNDYGGSDPGNVDDGLNYLAPRVRFALASNNYDAIADITTQTLWRRTKPNGPMTATSYAGNPCRVMQESINYALTVTSPTNNDYSVGWFGEATVDSADLFDQGPYRGCVFVIPASAAPGTGGTGGYSVNDANREGWPEIGTTNVAAGMDSRTATGGSGTTLVDSDGSTLASQGGNFVEITGGTGAGQKRKIQSATATQLTVDTTWSVNPDATSVYRVFTVPDFGNLNLVITEDWAITLDQTGQTEPWVFIQRGNGWAAGYDGAGNSLLGTLSRADFQGVGLLTLSNGVASTGWLAGEMPEASDTTVLTPDRVTIAYLDIAYRRSRDDTRRLITVSGALPSDDTGYYTSQTWGLERSAKGTITGVGLAVKLHDNVVTKWASQYVSNVKYGVALGDVPNGGDSVPWSSCVTSYCTPVYTGGVHGMVFDDWITESCDYGCWIHVDGGAEIRSPHIEAGTSVLNHYIIIGAVKCDAGNAASEGRYVAQGTLGQDCGTGGTGVAHSTAPVTQVHFTGDGFTPTISSATYAGTIVGDGATQSKGLLTFGEDFRFGNESIPANDPNCVGANNPYWYCTGAGTNPLINIHGPRFSKTGSAPQVRVVLNNAARLTSEPNTTAALWPYTYYKFPDTHVVEFQCTNCDINVNDVIARDGGFIPDGTVSETLDPYSSVALYPHHYQGNTTFTNVYFQKMICAWNGGGTDAGETESITVRPFLYDSNSAPVFIGTGLTLTEGTDAASSPKNATINTNTDHFDFASGAAKDYTGVWSLGLAVTNETDATDNNITDIRCGITYATLGDD